MAEDSNSLKRTRVMNWSNVRPKASNLWSIAMTSNKNLNASISTRGMWRSVPVLNQINLREQRQIDTFFIQENDLGNYWWLLTAYNNNNTLVVVVIDIYKTQRRWECVYIVTNEKFSKRISLLSPCKGALLIL